MIKSTRALLKKSANLQDTQHKKISENHQKNGTPSVKCL